MGLLIPVRVGKVFRSVHPRCSLRQGARTGEPSRQHRQPGWPRQDSGMVTLEFALLVPALLVVVLLASWFLRIGQVQGQLDAATRSAAREIAKGGSLAEATELARRVLPDVKIDAKSKDDLVAVSAGYHLRAPVPRLAGLGAHLSSELVVSREPAA
jgi:hypothetical protein